MTETAIYAFVFFAIFTSQLYHRLGVESVAAFHSGADEEPDIFVVLGPEGTQQFRDEAHCGHIPACCGAGEHQGDGHIDYQAVNRAVGQGARRCPFAGSPEGVSCGPESGQADVKFLADFLKGGELGGNRFRDMRIIAAGLHE